MPPLRCLRWELESQVPDKQRRSLSPELLSRSDTPLPALSVVRSEGNPSHPSVLGSLARIEDPRLWATSSEIHCAFSLCSSPSFSSACTSNSICRWPSALYLQLLFCFSPVPASTICQRQRERACLWDTWQGRVQLVIYPCHRAFCGPWDSPRLFCTGAWR